MTAAPAAKPRRRASRLNIVLVLVAVVGAIMACFFRFDLDPAFVEARYAGDGLSHFVEAGGIRFHIRDRGQGPVLVLLHGQSANFTVWEAAAELLATDHRVISVDMPGHGLTGPDPAERYSPQGLAASLDTLMVALGVTHFALAGNSLGGGVAAEYALAHPDKLSALLLLDPLGAPITGALPIAFAAETVPVVGQFVPWFTPQWLVQPMLASTFGDPARLTPDESEALYELLLRAGNRTAQYKTLLASVQSTLAQRLSGITTPTLLLWGTRDSWITPDHAAWFESHIPGIESHRLDGLGHQPMLEDPTTTVAAMRPFLAAHGG